MALSVIGVNDPKAIKKQSAFLAIDIGRDSYFARSMIGVGKTSNMPLQQLNELSSDAGDSISFDLRMGLRMKPVYGDEVLEGKEEALKWSTDSIKVDQVRAGVNGGGKMARKRTIHDLRDTSRDGQKEWWSRFLDEMIMMYLAGARGANSDFIEDTDFAGFADNAFSAPDSMHQLYGGVATSKASLAATDKMSLRSIDKFMARVRTMGGGSTGIPKMMPTRIMGKDSYVALMHAYQWDDVKSNTNTGQWIDIQKAAAAAQGDKNPLFTSAQGEYAGCALHVHSNVIQFNDYGAGGNVKAARALFLGRQAGVIAYGSTGGNGDARFDWNEETADRGNQLVITTSAILGVKKTSFKSPLDNVTRDFGVMALDTACAEPTA